MLSLELAMLGLGESGSERLECPICAGRGTVRGRAFRRGARRNAEVCGLCHGDGSVRRGRIAQLPRLRTQMQRVADLMQVGDGDAAAEEFRVAFRIAQSIMDSRA